MSRREILEERKMKNLIYAFTVTLIISIITFIIVFVSYNRKLKKQSEESLLELGRVNEIVSNNEIEETSFSDDKSKSEAEKENINNAEKEVKPNVESKKTVKNTTPVPSTVTNETEPEKEEVVVENNVQPEIVEEKKELKFQAPVSGEIIKDFAKDTLIYSNTLEEWTTHSGIDIKAEKTTVVSAAEEGIIESIKNDPRYGISITISHADGFKTIYSNLLTTEFIKEGEKVEKGQTIATVGETASFEVLDDSHLHFEMYKDEEPVNPTIYLK